MSKEVINSIDKFGYTALICEAYRGHEKTCEMLIPNMSKEAINSITNNGDTALIYAAYRGFEKTCEMLIPKMSKEAINSITNNGDSALTWAALKNLEGLCVDLIFKMTQKTINSALSDGKTALDFAAERNMALVCKMLFPRMTPEPIARCQDFEIIKKLQAESQTYSDKLVPFIIHSFKDGNEPKLKIEDCYKYTLYQENKNLIMNKLHEGCEDAPRVIEVIDDYIINNYFAISGICKGNMGQLFKLPKDLVKVILSHLVPCSLLDVNHLETDIYLKVKEPILSKVQKLAASGQWVGKKLFACDSVFEYVADLREYLGIIADNYSIKIAKMMCFEAINLGINDNKNQDLTCAIEFVKTYPELMNEIISEHPEYFVNSTIAKACIANVALQDTVIAQLPQNDPMECVEPIHHLNIIGDINSDYISNV